jgi:hypothetical protein
MLIFITSHKDMSFHTVSFVACNMEKKTGSLLELMQVPSVIMISLVVVVISNIWGFLDPTLEPHLREVSISGKS